MVFDKVGHLSMEEAKVMMFDLSACTKAAIAQRFAKLLRGFNA